MEKLNGIVTVPAFTGIGSRKTPEIWLNVFKELSFSLFKKWTLRSGHAEGADLAFEAGSQGRAEIYLPWEGFNGSTSDLFIGSSAIPDVKPAFDLAEKYHPRWDKLSPVAKKLIARDGYQVLGKDLIHASAFVVTWTEGGKPVGGTAQALKIAEDVGIAIFNAGAYEKRVEAFKSDVLQFVASIESCFTAGGGS